ncbi:hypothetical protein [Thermosulfurimonas sp. F29]|uniref:hypothetical protein n=1 Tax=Thermosulfurimonas sp. F29 TaxID=2867247 RepID=UPI001C832D43|nr:hypothetical protein [Thermosulfurimonas sp. F29]MBX6423530.1 hypothetical protein [Thermosulfurimonas sp. F29]
MLVAELVENGLSLNKALRLVDLSKSSYFYRSKKASYEEKLANQSLSSQEARLAEAPENGRSFSH